MTIVGLDTGFFIQLLGGLPECQELWRDLIEDRARGIVACLTLSELRRLALRGALEAGDVDLLLQAIQAICEIVWLDHGEVLDMGARLSHGLALPLVDALILASLISRSVREIWTTDEDLTRYHRRGIRIRLLSSSRPGH